MTFSPKIPFGRNAGVPTVTIHVGGIHASATPVRIETLLGSCIAVCLYDPSLSIGGMNHFLLPSGNNDPDFSTRYGINAMEVLINTMMSLGASRTKLQAKIFGGADIISANHPLLQVGKKNIEFIHRFLTTENIPIVNERTGGDHGITIKYFTHSFEVFMKRITRIQFHELENESIRYEQELSIESKLHDRSNISMFLPEDRPLH